MSRKGGATRRFLPTEYGGWHSVDKRFARWADLGVWARLFARVADDPELQAVPIEATAIRAHACAAGAPQKTADRRSRRSGARAAGSARRCTSAPTPAATR